ncbi:UDP-4-amino-4,6-dideoxy-N-acetyl-beta-L-altrosamine transaminase [Roseinatronobacter alkalisoli]|uniref:UDP-4-amino-4, 6-dideoxy-N-acetyl-beta-L-altrosamine transaminase n=1 Tax=Roseinatronobacter alkalisoli TaxID=3028235 RepID=A0ABT5T6R9_9RHOB|nr:UDP-4-amino-4,6-dideoxy-N-acetyl-beta-L-altrosamine transaminase [Roseinatronobacter sp. HJB301]MDD7970639.1 UDP-4-amino-4,6-dideoxy-N-acetyl-beta-L-altrosamine transaminase [Roseinatronobacter sp. HJB301]
MIPYGRQDISEDDIRAVEAVLRSDFLTQGPAVPGFEDAIARRTGATHAVAVNSATSALHIACMALGVGPGDLLWTVPNTFVASANVGLYCGADVDFVDIDPDTYLMCPKALAEKLAQAAQAGRLPKVIIPVHYAGQTADMAAIGALARAHGVRVIEDASHSIGASYRGAAVGGCAHSDITVFSFHPVKIITTAEGGCATTNDAELARRMVLARSHGVTRDTAQMQNADDQGAWYYEQIALGYNYRMTDMQAALGLSQMARLDDFIARRHILARRYDLLLQDLPLVRPVQSPDSYSALHLYPVQVQDRARVFAALRTDGIGVNVHYIPVHTHPFWRAKGFDWGMFPVAEAFYHRAISLPLHSRLSEADQDQVVGALTRALTA